MAQCGILNSLGIWRNMMKSYVITYLLGLSFSTLLTISSVLNASEPEGHQLLYFLEQANPQLSQHEILALFYQQSQEVAEIERFPFVDDQAISIQCQIPRLRNGLFTIFRNGEVLENTLRNAYIFATNRRADNWSYGQQTKLFFSLRRDFISPDLVDIYAANTEMTTTENGLLASFVIDQNGRGNTELYLRQSGDLISFKYVEKEGRTRGVFSRENRVRVRYGYCWNKN